MVGQETGNQNPHQWQIHNVNFLKTNMQKHNLKIKIQKERFLVIKYLKDKYN